jgi:uncharacterized protein YifE (UPF0438 family)
MKPSPYHKIFSKKRPYDLHVENSTIFTDEEFDILLKYGSWMEALEQNWIDPETNEQRDFVEFCRSNRDPANMFERAWYKLKERRKFEKSSIYASPEQLRNALINPGGNPDDWWSNPNR